METPFKIGYFRNMTVTSEVMVMFSGKFLLFRRMKSTSEVDSICLAASFQFS